MKKEKNIEHDGIVKSLENGYVKVSIIKNSACASCLAKDSCNLSEVEEKEIEIRNYDDKYQIGEQVKVLFGQSLGFKALLLGYVLPFIIVLFTLITLKTLKFDDAFAGLSALIILLPYYLFLYFARKKHKNTFSFFIKKI